MASLSLVAHEGPVEGTIYGTDGDQITIGRGSSCAVRLALSEISRRHATIRYHAGRYWVEDLQTLNGTRVNGQLIDGPTALRQGDRIRIGAQTFEVRFEAINGRQLVFDGPNSEAVSVGQATPAALANRGPIAPLGPLGFGLVAVLAVTTGAVLAFAITRQSHRAPAAVQVARPAPSGAVQAPPVAAPVRARAEVDGAVAIATREAGSVQWAAARGTPVREGDVLLRIHRNTAAKQRELDRINEKLEDDDSNPELTRRARALAEELASDRGSMAINSDFDGVVVAAPATGARLGAGATELRVARRVRLVVDASAVNGSGSACRISFLDQRLEGEGRRVVGGAGATIELTRFADSLSLDDIGRVRADCK